MNGAFRILKARRGTKFVILKVPTNPDAMSEHLLRREYEIAKDLHHPCIVSTIGFEPEGPAIVMEDIEGKVLDDFLAENPSLPARKALLKDILDGVDYLHHRGILHNDLKPSNIIVNTNGAARIIDFGLSVSDDSIYKKCIGGSEGFSAPEIISGQGPVGAASDIYSIGLLIKLIFNGKKYSRIATKCTSNAPEDRYASIRELKNAIRRKSRQPLAVTLALVIAAVCGLAAIQILGSEERAAELRNAEDRMNCEMLKMEKEMAGSFDSAVSGIKREKYLEFAALERYAHQKTLTAYLDSVAAAHPSGPDGSVPPEITAAVKVFNAQMDSLNTLTNALPSIATLPAEDQQRMAVILDESSAKYFLIEE